METSTAAFESPGVAIGEGTLKREKAGDRVQLAFTAPCKRAFDGGYELSGIYAALHDRDGRLVVRRSAEWGKSLLTNRAAWVHEFLPEQVSAATSLVYEIDYRFDYRRTVATGELPTLPAEADGSDWWRMVAPDPRSLTDRCARFDLGLFARSSSVEIWVVQHPQESFENLRTEFEFEMLDADGVSALARTFSVSGCGTNPTYTDTAPSIERRALRGLRFYTLRGRTEARLLARMGPFELG